VLEVEALSGPTYADVSLAVQAGEIVGLAGGGSSGKFDVADAIVGLTSPRTGSVRIAGSVLRPGSVPRALRAGVGFVPRDRHAQGFVEGLSVAENLTMTVPHRLGRHGWLDPGRRTEVAEEMIRRLDVVPPRPEQAVGELSGGNQQKVVAGRALADEPRVLVLMTPTAGVDVRSKESLMASAVGAAAGGAGVLLVTDDLEDLRYCHRLVVLFRGHVVAEHSESWEDRELVAEMEGMELTT
jgi:simple sugar transport system ATP-binding protein